jgi:hypothetical protein
MKQGESKSPTIKIIELSLFLLIWFIIFSIPFFRNRQGDLVIWDKVILEWISIFSFLLIFAFNYYTLVPKFLFEKKYFEYIIFTSLTVFILLGISMAIQTGLEPIKPMSMPPMDLGPGMPPMELGNNMQPPMGFKPPVQQEQKTLLMFFVENLIIGILVITAGTTLKMISQWLNEEGRRKDVEKEQLKTELALLRHQVSPHFFMNTLNNIHALIDINTNTAKDAVIRLSTLMRYLLYDSASGQTSLKKEVEFIESYVTLMKLRFSSKVIISIDIPDEIPDIQIPPMLFISFIENAFKHGVSYQSESFVIFKLDIIDNRLICNIRNSKHKKTEQPDKSYSGIGLSNIRKSLELLFLNNYTLLINETEKDFEAQLNIPMLETTGIGKHMPTENA